MTQQVELKLYWKAETDKAYLVHNDFGGHEDIWLPKSQVDIEEGAQLLSECEFLIPEWLAIDKGLV